MLQFKDFVNESINDRCLFKAIFIVGVPGAGKSYTSKKISGSVSPRIVNTDRAVEHLSKKLGQAIDPKDWQLYKDTALQVTKGALGNYLNGMLPLLVDGTSSDASNILHRVGILESFGYDVGMVFIDTPLEQSLKRAAARSERIVEPEFIKAVAALAEKNKKFFETKFDFFKVINNGDGELTDDVILKSFKQVTGFYTSNLLNPIGNRTLDRLTEKKQKYLCPEILTQEQLNKKLEGWYK